MAKAEEAEGTRGSKDKDPDLLAVIIHADRELQAAAGRVMGLEMDVVVGPREGEPFVEQATGMAFVWVPGGSFLMGASKERGARGYDPEAFEEEEPVRLVQITGFWMGVYPVTNEQYQRFMAETGYRGPGALADRHFNDPVQPVVAMSWDDARAFAVWLSGKLDGLVARLPTEAEWEYAARGTDGRRYPWGNEPPDATRATFGQSIDAGRPAVVGHTPGGVSPFGVHDLAGNIWEWCLDAWADSHANAGPVDPCHHDDTPGVRRVARGGSWRDVPRDLRSAFRRRAISQGRSYRVGFRMVCGGAHQPDS